MKICPLCRGRGYYDRWSITIDFDQERQTGEHEDDYPPIGGRTESGSSCDIAPANSPYWIPGAEVEIVNNVLELWVERSPCAECQRRRTAYADKREAKADRRRERAADLRAQSAADQQRSLAMLPYGGEPIKVGHHSEKRHRRDLERSHTLMGKAVSGQREAERLESLADASDSNSAISSDDPDLLPKLRARIADLEARRETIKTRNRAAKKAGREISPAFVLTNLGSNIRRLKLRLADAERSAVAPERTDLEIGEFTVRWDAEANRVQVHGPDPGKAGRKARSTVMRRGGFVWSRSNNCWQRQASQTAWILAESTVRAICAQD